jgi:hypothetical protein
VRREKITEHTLSTVLWTVVLVYVVHPTPVVDTVNCDSPSTPVLQAVPATSSPAALRVTAVLAVSLAQSLARKSVPLNPMQGETPTRGAAWAAPKERSTRRTGRPAPLVPGVIWRSTAVVTQAASTISPGFFDEE